ncbi:MAG TPA: hypothetical protein VFR84_13175, partial [Candidatus Angelobacter sp.]|nr:hypothetical protein [Candidatus Angelobacter sp.]
MRKTETLHSTPARAAGAAPPREASPRNILITLLLVMVLATFAAAQLPVPPSSQFDITGFIQSATLGGAGSGSGVGARQGGFITVNGHVITVPSNTIVILPASALTWQELFALAPPPYTGGATGMAAADVPTPLTTYEAHVVGNRVGDTYIAGLIWISQQALNSGQGFVNCISYANPAAPEIFVGGPIGTCGVGARIRINDPAVGNTGTGRYGVAFSPDVRFTVDQDNPTIAAVTGYPMCIPRFDPNVAIDPLCPVTQRPLVGGPVACAAPATAGAPCTSFTMANPAAVPLGGLFDPRTQAPFMVGDYVTYAGTLVQDATPGTPTVGPWPGNASTYIAAHTIVSNTAIYTVGGTDPAYVSIEVSLMGTGGLTVIGANEVAIRTRFEGFTSDVDPGVSPGSPTNTFPSQRLINIYGIDFDPTTGAATDRIFGQIGVDPGPPTGAAKGRWRFRPPCLVFGSVPAKPDKDCVMNQSGTFLPPPREVRAVIGASRDGTKAASFIAPITPASPTAANGIVYGQYHAPVAEYAFPEVLPGLAPIVENNFNTIPFLAQGGYTSAAGTLVGMLDPWPSNVAPGPPPPPPCSVLPTASTTGPYTAAAGGTIQVTGNATAPDPITFLWTATGGTFNNPALSNPLYTAPLNSPQETLTFTATTCAGSASASTTVAINAPNAPTVDAVAPLSMFSGAAGTIVVTGSDGNNPPLVPLVYTVVQAPANTLQVLTVTPGPNPPGTGATITFLAPTLPATQLAPTVVTLTITATNNAGIASAPTTTTVTVNPTPDAITPNSAEYRANQKRLIVQVTDPNPNVTLRLQPYLTTTGAIYNPDPAAGGVGNVFTNIGGGIYSLTISGAPAPACNPAPGAFAIPCSLRPLDVKSNILNVPGDSG